MAAATLAVLVPLSLRTTGRLTRRIGAIEGHVARIAGGEFGHTLPAAATAALAEVTKEWAAAARQEFGDLAEPDLHHRASTALEAALLREVLAHTGGNRTAAAKLRGREPMASSNSRRLSSSTGSPISSRRRGSTGIATTECLRRITS